MQNFKIHLFFVICLFAPLQANATKTDSLLQSIRDAQESEYLTTIYAAYPYFDSLLTTTHNSIDFEQFITTIHHLPYAHAYFYAIYMEGCMHKSIKKDNWTTLKIYRNLLRIAQDRKDNYLIVCALRIVGIAYKDLENYEEAYQYLQEAIKLNKETGLQSMQSNEFLEIGDYHYAVKKYNQAIKHYQKGLRLPQNPNLYYKMNYLNTIGICFVKMQAKDKAEKNQQLDSAIYYYEQSLAIAQQINHQWVGLVTGNVGFAYYQKGDWEKAKELLKQDVKISIESGMYHSAVGALASLSRIAIEQKKFVEAEQYIAQAQAIAENHHFRDRFVDIYKVLFEINKQKKNHAKALLFYEEYIKIRDSLDMKVNIEKIEKIQQRYEIKDQEKQISDLIKDQNIQKSQLQVQKLIIISVILGLLSLIVLFWVFYRAYQQKKEANVLLENKNVEIQKHQDEILLQTSAIKEASRIKNLLMETIIHDLKTPLSIIMHRTKDDDILQVARQMQNIVLNVLEVEKLEEVSMILHKNEENINAIVKNSLTQINALANQKNIFIENLMYENILVDVDNALIERVLTNLFTNAIRHTTPNGKIIIRKRVEASKENFIHLEVIDNGQGIPSKDLPFIFDKYFQVNRTKPQTYEDNTYRPSGLGLTFCKMVIEAHGGEIGAESELGKGTMIHFSLPLTPKQYFKHQKMFIFTEREKKLVLSAEDEAYLQPFIKELQKRDIAEYSALRKVLSKVDENKSPAIHVWKKQLTNAITTYNQSEFKRILQDEDLQNSYR
jgi:signal transduction histidine kinase